MKNPYLEAQILNAKAMARNFEQACKQAAIEDDGIIDVEEEKIIKKVHTITTRFIKALDKLT